MKKDESIRSLIKQQEHKIKSEGQLIKKTKQRNILAIATSMVLGISVIVGLIKTLSVILK